MNSEAPWGSRSGCRVNPGNARYASRPKRSLRISGLVTCLVGALCPAPLAAQEPAGTPYGTEVEVTRILTEVREVIGRSLIPIAGPKTVVLFGWGLGRYNAGHSVIEKHSYGPALAMLSAARASVFSLDITTADFHTLEFGLRRISDDTGGLYIKTNRFPGTAISKLTRMITSYCEFSVIPPPDLAVDYRIKVEVKRPGTEVFVRQNTPAWQ